MSLRIAPMMLHSIDDRGLITEVSDLWLTKLGYTMEEVIGRPSTDFLTEDSARYAREVVLPAFFATGSCKAEYEMRRKDGGVLPVRLHGVAVRTDSGAFVRSIAVMEDQSERRALESKMFEVQKLESLGLMAGTIAHDFNNLLASIVGSAEIGLRHAAHVPAAASALEAVLRASDRATDLCRQLLALSGRGRFQVEAIELTSLVSDMLQVLEVSVGTRAKVVLALANENTCVEVDATQIRQVVMNLVLNAVDAVDGNGTITIRTGACELDEAMIARSSNPLIAPGGYVCLCITDDGSGMTPEVLARIFEPFFTTKSAGRGLGLAATLGIVRGHHGALTVTSEPGQGAQFRIYLPAGHVTQRRSPTPRPFAAQSRGLVLVVDDDELLAATIARQLDEAGFTPHVAHSGRAALAQQGALPDLATFVIDVTMPDVTGPQLAQQLRERVPDAHIVLMSGFDRADMRQVPRARFLRKPFTEDELLAAVDPTLPRVTR